MRDQRLGQVAIGRVHVGVRGAGMHGIDRDAARPQIARQAAVEAGDGTLGQRVERSAGERGVLRHRAADVDDAATVLHVAHGLLRGDEDPGDIDGDHRLVVLELDLLDRATQRDAGVVHQDIQATEGFDRLGDGGTHGVGFTRVGQDGQRPTASRLDGGGGFFGQRGRADIGKGDLGAIGCQTLGDGRSDRARAAGHESRLAGQGKGLGRGYVAHGSLRLVAEGFGGVTFPLSLPLD
ncbi:hypothetical protein FQZ97_942350 [compost metagenome]